MSEKQKPRLHRLAGSSDSAVYSSNLEWFFGAMDSSCGNTSFMSAQVAVLMGVAGGSGGKESNHYTDAQVGFGKVEGHFTRGRRVWSAFIMLPWETQRLLAAHYEPRSYLDHVQPDPPEQSLRDAHAAYYKAEKDNEEA